MVVNINSTRPSWRFPSGGKDHGEYLVETAARKASQETRFVFTPEMVNSNKFFGEKDYYPGQQYGVRFFGGVFSVDYKELKKVTHQEVPDGHGLLVAKLFSSEEIDAALKSRSRLFDYATNSFEIASFHAEVCRDYTRYLRDLP